VGRPRAYCRRSCRQRAFEARRAAEELDWSANRVREAHRVIDDVAVIAAALSDAVAQRSVGPVDELRAEDVDELLDRVRRIAEDLQRRIDVTGHSTDDDSDSDVVGGRQETRSGSSGT
jgi:acyl-CoA reductase-like NAD-dependent aldehyde dehydrogenase